MRNENVEVGQNLNFVFIEFEASLLAVFSKKEYARSYIIENVKNKNIISS